MGSVNSIDIRSDVAILQTAGKYTNWEMGTHVPLFFRVPGMKTAGQRTSAFVEYVDIFPSLADAAGKAMHTNRELA